MTKADLRELRSLASAFAADLVAEAKAARVRCRTKAIRVARTLVAMFSRRAP